MSDEFRSAGTASEATGRRPESVTEDVAPHVDRAISERRIRAFRDAVLRADGPHHLAHYDRGVYEFAVDVLADPSVTVDAPAPPEDHGGLYREVGRQLSFMFTGLDGLLRDADTGRLIRVVLHAEEGAMVCCSVIPREHVIGIVLGQVGYWRTGVRLSRMPLVQGADITIGDLADVLRARIGLPSQNLGGWLTAKPDESSSSTGPRPLPGRVDPHQAVFAERADHPELRRLCLAALQPQDVIYVAHYERGDADFALDIFEHPEVRENWGHIPPATRRDFYGRFNSQFVTLASQLGRLSQPAISGRLVRVVLDVEEGAIYYYRLGVGEYLVGVAVNQSRVSQADDRMADLVMRWMEARA